MSNISIHDHFVRTILSDKTLAIDYFKSALPQHVIALLDFDTLQLSPDNYLSAELRKTTFGFEMVE